LLLSNVAVFVLTFAQIKILVSSLDPIALGAYFAILALSALVSVFVSLGLPHVVARYISKYDTLSWGVNAMRLMYLAWGCVIVLGVTILGLISLLGSHIVQEFYGQQIPFKALLWGCVFFVVFTLQTINRSSFEGFRRMEFLLGLDCLYWVIVVVLTWILRHTLVLETVFIIQACGAGVGFAVSGVIVFRHVRRLDRKRGTGIGDLFPFWYGAAATGAMGACFNYLDRFVISLVLTLEATSIFGIASKIVHSVALALGAPLFAFAPEVTRKWTLQVSEVMDKDIELAMKSMLALGTALAGIVALFSREIVLLVASAEYVHVPLLILLVAAIPLKSYYGVVTTVMRAINKIWYAVLSDVLWLVSYIALSIVLAVQYGVVGFGIAQLVAAGGTVVFNLYVVHKHTRAKLDYGGALKTIAAGATAVVLGILLKQAFATASPVGIVTVAVVYIVVFDVLYVVMRVMTATEIERLQSLYEAPLFKRAVGVLLGWQPGSRHR
jgi:O-antigen/teichoic acid export membrane protein